MYRPSGTPRMADPAQARQTIRAARPWFSEQEIAAILTSVEAVLESGQLIIGEYTEALENGFNQYVGSVYDVAIVSILYTLQLNLTFIRRVELLVLTDES